MAEYAPRWNLPRKRKQPGGLAFYQWAGCDRRRAEQAAPSLAAGYSPVVFPSAFAARVFLMSASCSELADSESESESESETEAETKSSGTIITPESDSESDADTEPESETAEHLAYLRRVHRSTERSTDREFHGFVAHLATRKPKMLHNVVGMHQLHCKNSPKASTQALASLDILYDIVCAHDA